MNLFHKRGVVVTGASGGIGGAVAEASRAEGAWVIGTRTAAANKLDEICQEWIVSDFSDLKQIEACADRVRNDQPDVLVNNAGINIIGPFATIRPADFLLIHQVNVFAPFMLCQAAIPGMVQKGWGRIVNVSSVW